MAASTNQIDVRVAGVPQLEVSPNPAFADEPVRLRLSRVMPGAKLTLGAAVCDDAGGRWESQGVYAAASDGSIDTGVLESVGGSYRGVDANGLFWSMALAGSRTERATFCKNGAAPDRVQLTAREDGGVIAEATLERRWLAANTEKREANADGFVGWLYVPPGRERRPVVIVLGGSGGGYDLDKAALLSRHMRSSPPLS